jgi:hypothetical protein
MNLIKRDGQLLMTKRKWHQLYKHGWYKHSDLWGCKWWIKFNWSEEEEKLTKEQ